MAAATIAAIGLGISAYSTYNAIESGKDQQNATNRGYDAQQKINDSNAQLSREVSGITKEQENIRKQIAGLEAMRAKRAIIRQAQLARATALSRATGAGAQFGSSFAGVTGGITSQSGVQIGEVNTNLSNSMSMFDLNAQIVNAQNRNAQRTGQFSADLATATGMASNAQGSAATYGQLGAFGGSLAQNAGTITDVGKSFGGLFK